MLALALAMPVAAQSAAALKSKIAIESRANGVRVASSSTIAEVERHARYMNGGKGTSTAFVLAQKKDGLPAAVAVVTNTVRSVFPTEVQDVKPPEGKTAFVGTPWREAPRQVLEHQVKCEESSAEWCRLTTTYQLNLSAEDVRALLTQKEKTIRIGTSTGYTGWTVPKAHLVATLDALGVLNEFQ
jgi:hypothetical protein